MLLVLQLESPVKFHRRDYLWGAPPQAFLYLTLWWLQASPWKHLLKMILGPYLLASYHWMQTIFQLWSLWPPWLQDSCQADRWVFVPMSKAIVIALTMWYRAIRIGANLFWWLQLPVLLTLLFLFYNEVLYALGLCFPPHQILFLHWFPSCYHSSIILYKQSHVHHPAI